MRMEGSDVNDESSVSGQAFCIKKRVESGVWEIRDCFNKGCWNLGLQDGNHA